MTPLAYSVPADQSGVNVELKLKESLSSQAMVISCNITRRHRVDWSITLSLFNDDDPAFLPRWTDAAAWDCLFDQRLEDPAPRLLQPSDCARGIVLLVGIHWS